MCSSNSTNALGRLLEELRNCELGSCIGHLLVVTFSNLWITWKGRPRSTAPCRSPTVAGVLAGSDTSVPSSPEWCNQKTASPSARHARHVAPTYPATRVCHGYGSPHQRRIAASLHYEIRVFWVLGHIFAHGGTNNVYLEVVAASVLESSLC